MVMDANLKRADLGSTFQNIEWSVDGSLALNTASHLTILKPKYRKEELKLADDLFDVQKVEISNFPRNTFYAKNLEDEVTSTNFSSSEDFVVKMTWSPLTVSRETYLAVITGSRSVHILKNGEIECSLDFKKTIESQIDFDAEITYSLEWLKIEDSLVLITGQADGSVKLFKMGNKAIEFIKKIEIRESSPILQIKATSDYLVAITENNKIFKVSDILSDDINVSCIQEGSRFLIYDSYLNNDSIFTSSISSFKKIDLKSGETTEVDTKLLELSKIVPNGKNFLLVSETKTVQIDNQLQIVNDDRILPLKSKRINRWNSKLDSINLKNSDFKIYGTSYNFSGNVLAILYNIEPNLGLKYRITSEMAFKIAFITLKNDFKAVASPMAIFQQFKLSNILPDYHLAQPVVPNNVSTDLTGFLRTDVLRDPLITGLISKNIVTGDQGPDIRKRYAQILLKFANNSNLQFEKPLDVATYKQLALLAGDDYKKPVGSIKIYSDVFDETFDFDKNDDPEIMISETNHKWNRCALTFLPIISTDVKIDPVTQRRVINISKDNRNDYGFFAKAILENLSDISIYSGCRFES